MSDSYSLEWGEDKLLYFYRKTPYIHSLKESGIPVKPTMKEWQEFELGLQEIGAFDWAKKYADENVMDGDYIEIWITFRKRIRCSCYHLEPPNFDLFLDLIKKLTKTQAKSILL